MALAIEAEGLTRRFFIKKKGISGWVQRLKALFRHATDEIIAVDHLSFKVKKGELFGLLGPNGAGKTTVIRLLSTLLQPDEGKARVNGFDVVREETKVRRSIGVIPGATGFYWRLSGRDYLKYFARAYGMYGIEAEKRIDDQRGE